MSEFDGATGKIHYDHWEPEEPRALVVFFHGLGEHIGSYRPLAETLNAAGFALWASDHLGHGLSEGVRVLINRVDDLVDDAEHLLRLARAAHPDLPVILAGHSLGSAVVTMLTAERLLPNGFTPAGLVLAGSSLMPVDAAGGLAKVIASGIDLMELRKDPIELTRDEAYARQIREDPLTWDGGIRLETITALTEGRARLEAVVESGALTLPVLLLHGEEDDLAPAEDARQAANLLPNARAVIFPLDRHNILNEIDRDAVYTVLVDFVRSATAEVP
jgi:alpha-beta hydrolase superfamily lysophospholipase